MTVVSAIAGESVMQATNEQFNQMQQTVSQLARTLAQTEQRHEQALRRQRRFFLATIALVGLFLYGAKQPVSTAFAELPAQLAPRAAPPDAGAGAAVREELVRQLPEENRQRLDKFEQEVKWVNQYMQTWDKGMAGAVVALMLYKMGKSMESVPLMHEQMETMNTSMNAIPVMAAEMQRMNANMSLITANMGVMTHNMDSTMGRMGRSMPWMPW
jgi:hypothetical protein